MHYLFLLHRHTSMHLRMIVWRHLQWLITRPRDLFEQCLYVILRDIILLRSCIHFILSRADDILFH